MKAAPIKRKFVFIGLTFAAFGLLGAAIYGLAG